MNSLCGASFRVAWRAYVWGFVGYKRHSTMSIRDKNNRYTNYRPPHYNRTLYRKCCVITRADATLTYERSYKL